MKIIYSLILILALLGLLDFIFLFVLLKFGFKNIDQDDNVLSESDLFEYYKKTK